MSNLAISTAFGAAYPVRLPGFEGPLELLLQLIEKEELDISTVSLVAVTDQYVQSIEQLTNREPGELADFLVVASKLLYIKSRALLPKPQPTAEDEEEDPGDTLLKQLLEYRQFKAVAEALLTREQLGLRTYTRLAPPRPQKQLDLSNVDVARLQAVLRRVLARIPSDPPMPRVRTYPITVSEQVVHVRRLLQRSRPEKPLGFTELLSQQTTRLEVVVTFLAVLELIKQQEVMVHQENLFGEILLTPVDLLAPIEDEPTSPAA
jgi:segregation and condensation protein A